MTTIYPTFNWKSFAHGLVRAVEDGDMDSMEDMVKDYRLFENIPCPSITIGGPDGGKWPSHNEVKGGA